MTSAPLSDFDARKLGFFCPFCGVKNNAGQTQCFVCGKKMPSFDADASPSPGSRGKAISGPNRSMSGSGAAIAARIGDRMIAVVLDAVLLSALFLFVFAVAWAEQERIKALPLSKAGLMAVAAGIVAIVSFIYYWLLEGAFGATFGKAIIGVRVGSMSRRGRWSASAIRNAIRIVEGAPLYVPAFFVALFSKSRRRIGDLVAQTVVVEHDLAVSARAGAVFGWLLLIGAALWGTYMIWPAWFTIPR